MVNIRAILLWLMMLAVPFQGHAVAAMAFCSPAPAHASLSDDHDHSRHDHATPDAEPHHSNVSSDDSADRHDASSAHDEASHKCGNCAACHAVGMMPTLDTPIFHGLPQADLAEPPGAMATVSPGVPHKPPRA